MRPVVLACVAAVLMVGCGGQQTKAEVKYLALGDSFTQGVGTADEQTEAFPAVLARRWRADGCDVELQNAGISGDTSGQILVKQKPEIESFRPTVVTFQAGANDIARGVSLDEYRRNVKAVLDAATAIGARVIVIGQNEWFRTPTGRTLGRDLGPKRDAYDDALQAETSAHGAEFVDLRPLYTEQADNRQWGDDGIHPTPQAYEGWATRIAAAVPAPCR